MMDMRCPSSDESYMSRYRIRRLPNTLSFESLTSPARIICTRKISSWRSSCRSHCDRDAAAQAGRNVLRTAANPDAPVVTHRAKNRRVELRR